MLVIPALWTHAPGLSFIITFIGAYIMNIEGLDISTFDLPLWTRLISYVSHVGRSVHHQLKV